MKITCCNMVSTLFLLYVLYLSVLDEPWRLINWGGKHNFLQHASNYNPQTDGQQLRILLHGPVGAGKSSFINSVQSVLEGRICKKAFADNMAQGCFTKKYTTYKIQKGTRNTFYPFVFNDMVGLKCRNRRDRRIHVKDVKRILKGHVQDGYTFNPESKLSKEDRYYNGSPSANDKVHVLVYVFDANTVSLMNDDIKETILDIRDEANELGIPQVAVFTKIDEACPEIKQDLKNVYKSTILQEKMEQFSATVGIPMNCIFPVKNYHDEISLNNDADILILSSLKSIIDDGNDFLNEMHV
ncbi:interferon-induced protein 44-like isoform X1 [Thunnus thynnus]|uniref:interferon-induced protein 44-like isoform X1 n=1 Tax=Thunnus thynnus TaxID=8237 RepID=UPI003528CA02